MAPSISKESQEIFPTVTEDFAKLKLVAQAEMTPTTPYPVKPGLPEAPENPYYAVRAVPSKGYGCFATTAIKRGTRILAEAPLLTVPVADYLLSDIEASFSKLSAKDQLLYFTLHSAHGQSPSLWPKEIHPSVTGQERKRILEQHNARIGKNASLVSIFQTNCMEMNGGAAVYLHAARFNHSCNPNACFCWNAAIGKETIHAICDIAEGDQITVAYIDIATDRDLRQWQLKHYGFFCDCDACTGDEYDSTTFAGQSAARRHRLKGLQDETQFLRGPYLNDEVQNMSLVNQLLEYVTLLREEGCYTPILADAYVDIALIAECNNDLKIAKSCAAAALKVKIDVQGRDCVDFDKYSSLLRRIEEKMK